MESDIVEPVFPYSPTAVAVADPGGVLRRVDDAMSLLLGRPASQLVGRALREFAHPADADLDDLIVNSACAFALDKRFCRPDGSAVWAEVRGKPVHGDDGEPLFFVLHLIDITDRKTAELLAARRLAQQQAVVALGRQALHGADAENLLPEAVAAVKEHLPAHRATVTEISVIDSQLVVRARAGAALPYDGDERGIPLGPDSLRAILQHAAATTLLGNIPSLRELDPRLRAAGVQSWISRAILVDGEPWGLLAAVSFDEAAFSPHDSVFVEAVADVIGSSIALRRYRDATTSTLKEGRLIAAGAIAAGVAHDVGNVLAVLKTQAQLLASEADGGGRADLILREVDQLVDLIDRILDVARSRGIRPQRLHITSVLQQIAPMLRRMVRSAVQLHLELPAEYCEGWVDPAALQQIVLNLVLNASAATPDGGAVTVRSFRQDEGVAVTVTDTGRGMTAEVERKAFDSFFTTDLERGTGLGLAQVRTLVRQHGGRVELDTAPGRGTSVSVWFPDEAVAPDPVEG